MQSGENKISKTRKARPNSPTRSFKRIPSYVVAFFLKETYDDLITAQQMICKKSPQESTNSITPTNSLKMFETEHSDKLNHIVDKPDAEAIEVNKNNSSHDTANCMGSTTPTSSLMYLSSDDTSDASLKTIGEKETIAIDLSRDVVENTTDVNSESEGCDDLIKKATTVEDVIIIVKDKETCKRVDENAAENNVCFSEELTDKALKTIEKPTNDLEKENTKIEPEDIFKAKNNRRYKKKKLSKRPKKTVNIKHKSFKYKNPKKLIDNRLEKYYGKRNLIDADQIQKELYSDEVTTVVSRTRVLHKIIARENLLEESEFISFINDIGLNEYDGESLSSSMSTAKKSIVSNSSQSTLTQTADQTSSVIEDENLETINSVIKMSTEKFPYKTDVINVAVAVAYNISKVNAIDETVPVPSQETFMHLRSLTSSEIVTPFVTNLTSNLPSKFEDFKAVTIETSHDTLVNKQSSFDVSSDDFVIARTSSDFDKSSDESTDTLKNNTETVIDIETVAIDHNVKENKPTLLETVINLGIYPEISPSTSSDTAYECNYNDVIVTKNLNNKYALTPNKGDNKEQEINKNILKKAINHQKEKVINKTINLPNQADIKALLKENEMPQMKCAEEFRHPSHMPEMWDRLVMTLDLAVKRLEDNLVEKIIKELKNTLGHHLPKDTPVSETKDEKVISEIVAEDIKPDLDSGLQCDLVKNITIDQIMKKLSSDGPKIIKPGFAVKALQNSKLFKDIKVLKPPEAQMMTDKGDTVTVSTITYEVCNFSRLKTLFTAPINFIRENVFVITSVPTFLVVLLCVYGLILLAMKLW